MLSLITGLLSIVGLLFATTVLFRVTVLFTAAEEKQMPLARPVIPTLNAIVFGSGKLTIGDMMKGQVSC